MSDLVTLCLSNEFYMTSFFHILNIHFPTEHALKNVCILYDNNTVQDMLL